MQSIYLRSTHGGIGTTTFGYALAQAMQAVYFIGRGNDSGAAIAAGLGEISWPSELWLDANPEQKTRADSFSEQLPEVSGLKIAAGVNPPKALREIAAVWSESSFAISELKIPNSQDFWVAPNSLNGLHRLKESLVHSNSIGIAILKTSARLPVALWQSEFNEIPIIEIKFQQRVFRALDLGYGLPSSAHFNKAVQSFHEWQKVQVELNA